MASSAGLRQELAVKKPSHYRGTTTRNLKAKELGRFNDLEADQPMTVWSVDSGDDIPTPCKIPLLEVPSQLPISLKISLDNPYDHSATIPTVDRILRWAEAVSYDMSDVDLVMGRGLMKKICQTPYNRKDQWKAKIYRYKNTICMESVDEESSHENSSFAGWGKVFEDVMKTGGRRTPGYMCEDVDVRMPRLVSLGPLKILTNSRISCQLSDKGQDRPGSYVELKTVGVISTEKNATSFKRYKCRNIWAHCKLLGIETVYIGYRTSDGELQKIQRFSMGDLEKQGEQWWSPEVILSFMKQLLSWVMTNTIEGVTYSLTYDGESFTSPVCLVPEEHEDLVRIVKSSFPDEV
ncbi:hypothetical protein ACHWQZ_G017501 [Mnemiopsis leidyi]